MTQRSVARVETDRPARYGKQLVAHLGRRNGGEWLADAERGWIILRGGRAEICCVPGGLSLTVEGDDESLDGLEDVVARHLIRFGAHDELLVHWAREDRTP